jgi:HK97 family phage portal protein
MGILRQSFEKRIGYGEWDRILDRAVYGMPSATGINVSDSSAMTWSVVWGCVNCLSQDMAKLPLPTYRRLPGDAGREEARGHWLWKLFRVAPNPFMTPFTFRQTMQKHLSVRGNAYAIKEFDTDGSVKALYPRAPDRMSEKIQGGQLTYTYRGAGGAPETYPPEQVFHLKGLSDDGITGLSPVEIFREGIGLGLAYQQHAGRTFANGARIPMFVELPSAPGKDALDKMRADFQDQVAGVQNAGKIPFMWGGMTLKPIGFSNQDAQFVESRHLSVEDACRIWRMPPHKVMDYLRATFSNVTEINISYVGDTLMPWQVMWEQSIHQQLLSDAERDEYYVEHDNYSLLKGTPSERATVESQYVLNGVSNINEIRRSHNWNPVPGGDKNRVQMQMMPIDAPPGLAQPAAPPKQKE